MCLISFNLPGLDRFPFIIHNFLESPPFQCLVVKPNISVFTWHLSRVLPMISAHIAAKLIDLPRIDPELSINKVTMVSLKSFSVSCLKLRGYPGLAITLCNLELSRIPSSRLKFQLVFCLAKSNLCSLFANFPMVDMCGLIKLSNWFLKRIDSSFVTRSLASMISSKFDV